MQRLVLAILAFVAFTTYTVFVAANHSLFGFLAEHAEGGWKLQVFIDLVIAAVSFNLLALPDAKRLGLSAWPYFIATFFLGSIAILAYFVRRELHLLKQPALAKA